MSTEPLNPCPHCGRQPETKTVNARTEGEQFYSCKRCFSVWLPIEIWGARPIEDALRAEIEQLQKELAHETLRRVDAQIEVDKLRTQSAALSEACKQSILWLFQPCLGQRDIVANVNGAARILESAIASCEEKEQGNDNRR